MTGTCKLKLYFITSNKHKYMEVLRIAEKYGICLEMMPGMKFEIQSDSLEEISIYSAIENYKVLRKPLMVEDAGLFIKALNGFPGPYSSYVYKTIGINGILKLMEGVEDRRAYFMSVVTIIAEPIFIVEKGLVNGLISNEPRGSFGFGFDPIFIPEGSTKTFAEMTVEEKNKYSHRAKAVEKAFKRLLQLKDVVKT